ncbi:flavin reductase family protein [Streptomyces bambusae]|uniref:flavin reductase family protein n=1 Tax=Streptomyces bambusae TaxID=1550616 RepID=UPI001CFD4302|nr:flavin reductase family protein [Streptomyces bambusae]MCB5166147.1 flavin reductase family protein [Streptomyces bambusae]
MLKTRPLTAPSAGPAATGSPHAEGVSNDEFRAAMSRLAAGVVLVTAQEPPLDEPVGMTATAFMSVSLDPPLVLVGLREGSRMDDLLAEQPLWAVSVLAESQRHVAARFAMKGRISDRLLFADVPHERGSLTGAPLVSGALATLECRTESRVEAGDHTLVIGRVLAAGLPPVAGTGAAVVDDPLLYFRGRYRHLGGASGPAGA